MRRLRASFPWLGVISLVVALVAGGCASRGRGGPDRYAPQPVLVGQTDFFEGLLVVEGRLGPFRLNEPDMPFSRTPPAPGEGVPVPVRDGTFGGRADRDAGTGFPRGFAEEGAFGEGAAGGRGPGRGGGGGPAGALPRQSMTLTLRSASEAPVTVRVVEVKSALGNFVPVPEHFTLPPRGVQALEAMRSAYPAPIDELEVLVSLRIRDRAETHILKLELADRPLSAATASR